MKTPSNDRDHPVARTMPASNEGKRSTHRQRTLKQAKVILTDSTTMDCTIRDLSEGGARLAFGDASVLPAEFRLLITSDRLVVPVRLLWQRGLLAGVRFDGPQELAPPGQVLRFE